ncbi:hypothetical protein LJ739_08480 [Aestuariibacter halophilus]|uniref:Uncharacterized protein n=1 Tax=Fluctibacter halophilus TaxID=226011 RepID=A0ABS8G6Q9_9ALTE|nr:hypothetical protein [Aestuariibacter halophilus]MCC2616274.1 hypothetical protein [Aestuariibacter halophilus]
MTPNTDPNEKPGFFDKPSNVAWILRIFYALCILLFVTDFVVHRHIYTSWEEIPAFYALYGFVACVVLVLIAKQMRHVLMRSETYYDKDTEEESHVDR